jgi:tropomyosin
MLNIILILFHIASFREADVKAEHFERKVQQLEAITQTQEEKIETLQAKLEELQKAYDETYNSLMDL